MAEPNDEVFCEVCGVPIAPDRDVCDRCEAKEHAQDYYVDAMRGAGREYLLAPRERGR